MRATPTPAALGRGLLFVHLLLSPLAFSGATAEAFETNKVALLQLTAVAAAGLAALAGRPHGPLLREPVTLGALLFTLSAAVSTVGSLSPRTSLFGAPES